MSEGKSEGKKAPPLGVGGRTKSWVETTEFPVAPTEQPRAGVILFHEPSKEGDDDESCSDHTDADTDALLMTASSQRDLMEELQRVQASVEVYHDAGTRGSRREEHAGVRGAAAAAAAAAGLSKREGGRLCGEVCGGRGLCCCWGVDAPKIRILADSFSVREYDHVCACALVPVLARPVLACLSCTVPVVYCACRVLCLSCTVPVVCVCRVLCLSSSVPF